MQKSFQWCIGIGICIAVSASPAQTTATYVAASDTFLGNPHDLKLGPDGKSLYVADVNNNRVAILDPETLELTGMFGSDHQSGTHDIDFDKEGNAYVADTHNNRVTIYRIDGNHAELIGELNQGIRGPEGVLVHPNGRIYVAGAWSGNVAVYEDGELVDEMRGLASPHDLELDPQGNIWLAEAGRDRMLLLSPELSVLETLEGSPFEFDGVRYQDVMADGTLVAADKYSHSVKVIDPQRNVTLVIGDGRPGKGEYKFTTPEGVELRGDTVWISDSGNNRIVKYRLQ